MSSMPRTLIPASLIASREPQNFSRGEFNVISTMLFGGNVSISGIVRQLKGGLVISNLRRDYRNKKGVRFRTPLFARLKCATDVESGELWSDWDCYPCLPPGRCHKNSAATAGFQMSSLHRLLRQRCWKECRAAVLYSTGLSGSDRRCCCAAA